MDFPVTFSSGLKALLIWPARRSLARDWHAYELCSEALAAVTVRFLIYPPYHVEKCGGKGTRAPLTEEGASFFQSFVSAHQT